MSIEVSKSRIEFTIDRLLQVWEDDIANDKNTVNGVGLMHQRIEGGIEALRIAGVISNERKSKIFAEMNKQYARRINELMKVAA